MRKQPAGTYNNGLVVMSNSELDYAAEVILAKLGSSDQDVADIIFDTDIGDSIGTFTDTYANGAIGSHPANTTTVSDTYTLYQNTSSASETNMIMPAKLDGASGIKPQTSNNLNDSIITRALDKIASANTTYGEAGTYYITSNLSNVASTPVGSGTWKTVSTVYDEVTNDAADDSDKVTYELHRRTSTSTSSSSSNRPMTIDSTTPSHIKEMTDTQLEELAQRLRNRIIATGIGTYALQANAPGTGTWIARGALIDRVPNISQVAYSRGQQYTRRFTGQYTRESIGYAREYGASPYVRAVYGTGNFTSTRFTRIYSAQYERSVIGPSYNALYERSLFTKVTPTGHYASTYTAPAMPNTSEQQSLYALGVYSLPDVSGTRKYIRNTFARSSTQSNFSAQYVRDPGGGVGIPGFPQLLQFSRVFQRANFTRLLTGPTYYRVRNTYSVQTFQRQFTRIYSAQYTRYFVRGNFSRSYQRNYSGQYSRAYRSQYERGYIGLYQRNTVGPTYIRGNFTRNAVGPSYERKFTRVFSLTENPGYDRITPGPGFIENYYREINFVRGTFYRGGVYGAAYGGSGLYSRIGPDGITYENYSRAFIRQYNRDPVPGGGIRGRGYSTPVDPITGNYLVYARNTYRTFYTRINSYVQTQEFLFTRIYTAQYLRGEVTNYSDGPAYGRGDQYTRIYSGTYEGQYTRIFSGNYKRGAYQRDQGTPQYTSEWYFRGQQYTRITPGPSYDRGTTFEGQYSRGQFERQVTGPKYDGELYAKVTLANFIAGYVRTYTGEYYKLYAQQYSRVFNANYDRSVTGPQYASDFDVYARQYSAQYEGTYSRGDQYTREFSGNTVRPDNEVSFTDTSTILWLRVA